MTLTLRMFLSECFYPFVIILFSIGGGGDFNQTAKASKPLANPLAVATLLKFLSHQPRPANFKDRFTNILIGDYGLTNL